MSKYSTDELCGILGYWRNRLRTHNEWDESLSFSDDKIMIEIKRKLHSADTLAAVAKGVHFGAGVIFCESNPGLKHLKKAIADYEGKS